MNTIKEKKYIPFNQSQMMEQATFTYSLCKPSDVAGMSQMKHPTTSHQDVSVVRVHDIFLERRDNISRGRNKDVPSVRLLDVSNMSQMEHPTMSPWYVTKIAVIGFQHVSELRCRDTLLYFHDSIKYQIRHNIFLVPTRRETKRVVGIIN